MHLYLRHALREHSIEATFFDVPPAGAWRRLVAAPVPGLARLDGDLQALRYQLAQSASVRRHLNRLGPGCGVLHIYTQNAALLSAGILRSLPSVVSTDTTNLVNAYQLPYRRPGPLTAASLRPAMALERRAFLAATLVVAQSRWTADQLSAYGVVPDRVRVIPFGVTVPPPTPRQHSDGVPRITFIGSTMIRKGGWQLLRIFQESLRDRCRLMLVTQDTVPATPGIEVLDDVRPGDGRINGVLERSDVFVLPTEIDKVPYSVLEAMAVGLPVVSTRVGAIPEMVADGITGILVDAGDDRGLVVGLRRLVDDPDARRRMGEAARRRVLDHFDARRTTAALLDVLVEARDLHRPPAGRAPRAGAFRPAPDTNPGP